MRHPVYRKATRNATSEVCHAKRNFERKLAANIDTDRKSFYAYVRRRSKVKSNIGPLTDDNGNTTALPQDLADSFNQFFASVFTVENLTDIPSADNVFTE